MKQPRDSQRSRLYAAERSAFRGYYAHGMRLACIHDLRAFIHEVLADEWFSTVFGRFTTVHIKDGRGTRHAYTAYDQDSHALILSFPRWSRTRPIALHEISHAASIRHHGLVAAHGPEFAGIFLRLVRQYLGEACHVRLRWAFMHHRVRFDEDRSCAVHW